MTVISHAWCESLYAYICSSNDWIFSALALPVQIFLCVLDPFTRFPASVAILKFQLFSLALILEKRKTFSHWTQPLNSTQISQSVRKAHCPICVFCFKWKKKKKKSLQWFICTLVLQLFPNLYFSSICTIIILLKSFFKKFSLLISKQIPYLVFLLFDVLG